MLFSNIFKDFIYYLLESEKGGGNRGRGTSIARETLIDSLSCAPNQGPHPQARHEP